MSLGLSKEYRWPVDRNVLCDAMLGRLASLECTGIWRWTVEGLEAPRSVFGTVDECVLFQQAQQVARSMVLMMAVMDLCRWVIEGDSNEAKLIGRCTGRGQPRIWAFW